MNEDNTCQHQIDYNLMCVRTTLCFFFGEQEKKHKIEMETYEPSKNQTNVPSFPKLAHTTSRSHTKR